MASQYNVEPQPTAKVILNTTVGDLTLELFGKQTPLATRNFLQHCLDGYYTNSIVHRVVPGFILQAGDPTGTGSGGISAINNGEPFQDEFHSRLKFNRRGLVGMANEGKDSNTSQFFFTLGATPELQGKNTMFGRIEGDTIYNLIKMGDAELAEGTERPLYPMKITGSEILLNPFTDMTARAKIAPRVVEDKSSETRKRKKPAGKNVLSFGGDDAEDGVVVPLPKKSKANPKLVQIEEKVRTKDTHDEEHVSLSDSTSTPPPQVSKQSLTVQKPGPLVDEVHDEIDDDEDVDTKTQNARRQEALDRTNAEIAALKSSMKRTNAVVEKPQEKPRSALEAMIPATSTRGRKRGKAQDGDDALDLFNAFKSKLETIADSGDTARKIDAPAEVGTADKVADDEEAELCDLHFIANCQSCKAWDDEDADDAEDDDDDTAWMSHKLTFAKDTLGKDLEWRKKMEEIEVIDPREKARALMEASRKEKAGRRK